MKPNYIVVFLVSLFLCFPAFNYAISYDQRLYDPDQDIMDQTSAVYDNKSLIYGKPYSQWTSLWWEWAYSIPKELHPAYDDYGHSCRVNQSDPVWYFPGTFNHSTTRYCIIPSNVSILFPVLNTECSYLEYPLLKSENDLRKCAKSIQDHVDLVNATLDGKVIADEEIIRTQSPLFNFTLPADSILDYEGNTSSQAISDGSWIFLRPLPVGDHIITFRGDFEPTLNNQLYDSSSFSIPEGWNYETIYELVVVPPDDILSPPFSISESSSNKKHDDLSDLLYIDLVTKNQNITNEYKKVDISFLTKFLNGSIGWEMISNNESGSQILVKEYHFNNFPESVKFSYKVSQLAQMLNHHPAVTIDWNKVKIELVTWSLNNKISNLDIKSAVLIDEMYNSMY